MQCKEFASLLEQQGLSPLPAAAQDHLATCETCQDLLADLGSIVAAARELPAEVDPPQRIWISLRSQLEAEGVLKEPVPVAADLSSNWFDSLRAWFTPRRLVTASVGLSLAIAAFLQFHKPQAPETSPTPVEVAKQPNRPEAAKPDTPVLATPQVASTVSPTQLAGGGKARQAKPLQVRPLRDSSPSAPSPSENIQFVDSVGYGGSANSSPAVQTVSNPELDETLRTNLRTVDEFIAECQAHLKKHPTDTLAREYLQSAILQRQELIGAMLDSGRSEQ